MESPTQVDALERPFVAAPDPDRYFPATVIEEARRRLTRSIERGEGPALLIGGTGTGKSLLLEVLARQFRGKMSTVLLGGAQLCTRRALQQSILFQLGLPYRQMDEGDLRLSLLEFLRPLEGKPRKLLLLVDEADSLPTRLLEELRALTNISYQGELLVGLVLVGSARLEERFAEPELEVFAQRLSHRCYLAPLGREETFQYLRSQVAAVGIDPNKLFAQDGLEAIFVATDGVPRLINQIGDQLVWLVGETGYAPIDAAIVQQAWSELQQIPAPWNLESTEELNCPVEFGELSGEPAQVVTPISLADDDEMPASIPINPKLAEVIDGVEYFDTESATDQILEHFDQYERPASAPAVPQAKNPFQEEFVSEEVVFDRYFKFEHQMLSAAPRVINRLDTAFAQDLRLCEVEVVAGEASSSLPDPEEPVHSIELLPLQAGPEGIEIEELCEDVDFGDVLVIEDEVPRAPLLVPSRKFRQLFSSLETAMKPHRVG